MKKNLCLIAILAIILSLGFAACEKNDSGTSNLKVRLTDAPVELDSVFVEILEVKVKMGTDSSAEDTSSVKGWVNLKTNQGIYNLLRLQNGVDTLLAAGDLPTGYVKEIRFVLGTNNRVVDSLGVSYPLTIPSGGQSGLKIKVNKNLRASIETLVIDFDTDLSIKKEVSGYKLRPVLKVK